MNPFRRRQYIAMQGAGGAAAFSPTDIAGLQLWLDASQIVGLNDGDAVATWSDLSGNGRDATQASASNRPTFKTNIQNGRPVVRFDGVDDILGLAGFAQVTNTSVWAVYSYAGAAGVASSVLDRSVGWGGPVCYANTGGKFPRLFWSTSLPNGITSAVAVDTSVRSVRWFYSDAVMKVFVSGVETGSANITSLGTFTSWISISNLVFGDPFNGDLCELIVATDVSAADVNSVESYIRTKWGTP